MVRYFDAHNHLQDPWLDAARPTLATALPARGLVGAVVNGTHEGDWSAVSDLARQWPWVRPSYGLHPWMVGNRTDDWLPRLTEFLRSDPMAAVGEIGLDRWILDGARPDDARLLGRRRAPLEEQESVFLAQLDLAARENRPVTIHCLQAWGRLDTVLRSVALPARGFLLHAYGGPREMLAGFIDRGAYFSFNGAFLAERKLAQREVFRHVPADRLLVETDAPAMPLPREWQTHKLPRAPDGSIINHPGNIDAAYAGLAALRGLALEDLTVQVESNFIRLFGP